MFRPIITLCLGFLVLAQQAMGQDRPWAVSLYAGPSTTKYFGAMFQDGDLRPTAMMIGVTLDRKLFYLGYDIYVAGEVQATQYVFGHTNTTFAATLGLQCERLFGFERTSFSAYTGPSYALDPPHFAIGYKHRVWPTSRDKFLNAVALEFASGLPFTQNWDWTVRMYHRSGIFGVYSDGNDDGTSFGLGLKYHF